MEKQTEKKTLKSEIISTDGYGLISIHLIAITYLYHVPPDTRYRVTQHASRWSDSCIYDTYAKALAAYNSAKEMLVGV